ncbi:sigma factor [Streptomyces buecherae]
MSIPILVISVSLPRCPARALRADGARHPYDDTTPPNVRDTRGPDKQAGGLVVPARDDPRAGGHGSMTDHATTHHDESDAGLDPVIGERQRLVGLAYLLLGPLTEVEDVVQETYTRWYAMPRRQQDTIASPGAWLATVATRVCLDLRRSARVRRERHVGAWLPERRRRGRRRPPTPSRAAKRSRATSPAWPAARPAA